MDESRAMNDLILFDLHTPWHRDRLERLPGDGQVYTFIREYVFPFPAIHQTGHGIRERTFD